jgi:hypothetical protein
MGCAGACLWSGLVLGARCLRGEGEVKEEGERGGLKRTANEECKGKRGEERKGSEG